MSTNPHMIKTLSSSQQFTWVWKLSPWPQLSLTPTLARALSHKWPSQLGVSNSLFFQTSCFLKHLSRLPGFSRARTCISRVTPLLLVKHRPAASPGQQWVWGLAPQYQLTCSCPYQSPGSPPQNSPVCFKRKKATTLFLCYDENTCQALCFLVYNSESREVNPGPNKTMQNWFLIKVKTLKLHRKIPWFL